MYTEYYGFREKPFELAPNPRYLYPTRMHREALAALTYGIRAQKGFLLLSGQPGSGKTTIVRHLLRVLPTHVRTSFLFNTELTYEEFLRAFLRELRIPHDDASREEMLLALNQYLLTEYKAGNSVLLILDEAQNLSAEVLENIRMLSNLETDQGKPLQILLVGQPGLWQKVNQPELQQLGQRVTVVCHLGQLAPSETRDYIGHRLHVAGSQGRRLFTRAALRQIHRQSMGNPRLINVICDEALLYCFIKGKPRVTRKMIKLGVGLRRVPRRAYDTARSRVRTTRARTLHRYAWTALWVFLMTLIFLLASTFTRDAELSGLVSGVTELLGLRNARGERLTGGAHGEARRGDEPGTVMVGSEAPPINGNAALLPRIRRLLEDHGKPGSPRGATQQSADAEPPTPAAPQDAVSEASQPDVVHQVQRGETLAAVAMVRYGRSDPMVLNLLRRHNPAIVDIDLLTPGWRLGVPSLTPAAWVQRLDAGGFGALVLTTPSVWEANKVVWLLGQEGLQAKAEAIRVSAQTQWFEVLIVGLASADEAARLGAIYQKRWRPSAQVGLSAMREK